MLNNYEMIDLTIETIEAGKINAGQKFISCLLKNMRKRMAQKRGFALFREMDPERFDAILAAFPATGTDSRQTRAGKPWNGTGTTLPADFKYEDAVKALRNVNGENLLMLEDCEYETFPLPGYYVRKFYTAMGGHQAGEWIMEPDGKHIAVINEIPVLVMKYAEDGSYVEGWEACRQARSQMKRLIRLEDAIADPTVKALIAPRYLPNAEVRMPDAEGPENM